MNTQATSKQPVKSKELSNKHIYTLGVIDVLIRRNPDLPPTMAEIARYLDITKQGVGRILKVLEREGYVIRSRTQRRSIRLTGKELIQKGRAA